MKQALFFLCHGGIIVLPFGLLWLRDTYPKRMPWRRAFAIQFWLGWLLTAGIVLSAYRGLTALFISFFGWTYALVWSIPPLLIYGLILGFRRVRAGHCPENPNFGGVSVPGITGGDAPPIAEAATPKLAMSGAQPPPIPKKVVITRHLLLKYLAGILVGTFAVFLPALLFATGPWVQQNLKLLSSGAARVFGFTLLGSFLVAIAVPNALFHRTPLSLSARVCMALVVLSLLLLQFGWIVFEIVKDWH